VQNRKVDYKEKLRTALDSLKDIQDDISNLNNELSVVDKKEQDLLHMIEIVKASASEGFSLYKQLHEVRNERRDIKDRLEEAKEIRDFMQAFKAGTRNTIERKIKLIDNVRESQEKKTYTLKVLTHLQPYNKRNKAVEVLS
jgi:hypothetical protein